MKRARTRPLQVAAVDAKCLFLLLLVAVCRSTVGFSASKRIRIFGHDLVCSDHGLLRKDGPYSRLVVLSQGMSSEEEDDEEGINGKRGASYDPDELQTIVNKQQEQIDQLLSMVVQNKKEQPPAPKSPVSVASTFATISKQQQAAVATAAVNPLKAMMFIDGTWLYYSIHEREAQSCPIIQKYGKGWQRRYYFDWSALPRVICAALHEQDPGWAVQSRPVEIVRASVYTSYKSDTSPNSYRFRMYQDMSNANYDVHMMETVGRNEKCVDINIAVDMLHYATVPNAYDVALLLTGDKDFIPAMTRTRQKGRKVGLVSMRSGCNRALSEIPTDSNNNNEHNYNIRDYDVVWIEDYLDELIKPKREGDVEKNRGDLTTFTFTKILSDFISQSGMSRVNSRDIGRYLKIMTIGGKSLLDELKLAFGGLRPFFFSTGCFAVQDKSASEKQIEDDWSYWVGLSSDADMTLMEEAKTAKLSSLEKKFFDTYSLEPLEDKEFAYFQSLKLVGLIEASRETPDYDPERVSSEDADNDELELPGHLTQDYSQFTVPKLKEYCAEYGLKASGKKAELLDRIQAYVDEQTEELQKQHDEEKRSRIRQLAEESSQVEELPEHLTRDYSQLTLAKLKEFCRENGLKVSGTKVELLDRIQVLLDEEKEKLQKEIDHKQRVNSQPPQAPSATGEDDDLGYLESLVVEFARASGGQATSRDLGRYLAVNKASPTRRSATFNSRQQRCSALQELKERHGSIASFVNDRPFLFEKKSVDEGEFEDPDDPMNKFTFYVALKQSPYSLPQAQPLSHRQDGFGGQKKQVDASPGVNGATKDWGYLEALIAGYLKQNEGQATSRELGRYLSTNKASPERLAVTTRSITALQELKEKYKTILNFAQTHAAFERREMDPSDFEDPNDPHNTHTFYVAMKDLPSSLSRQGAPPVRQEVS